MTDTQHFISDHRNDSDAELAAALVQHAGQLPLRMRANGLDAEVKTSVSDVVTEADRAAEKFVADVLEALRGDDGVIGEEGASRASSTGRTWVIDPVDGTYNFSQGSDYFCSAIALVDDNSAHSPAIGAVHRPATDTTWIAADGAATRDGVELGGLAESSLGESAVVTYLHPTFRANDDVREAWLRVVTGAATMRMMGAGSVDLSNLASGQMGAWLQHTVPDWDWLPGKALVEAVGGRCIKVDAGDVTWCVAGNPQIVGEIAERLQG